MRFKQAVLACAQLRNAYQPGLQALRKADRNRIECARPRRLAGSVDVDTALQPDLPNDPRWDYGIGYYDGHREEAIWIEVHRASSSEVAGVVRKVEWLQQWIGNHARDLFSMTRCVDGYVWLASGGVSFQRGTPQARQLALAGVSFPRGRLRL